MSEKSCAMDEADDLSQTFLRKAPPQSVRLTPALRALLRGIGRVRAGRASDVIDQALRFEIPRRLLNLSSYDGPSRDYAVRVAREELERSILEMKAAGGLSEKQECSIRQEFDYLLKQGVLYAELCPEAALHLDRHIPGWDDPSDLPTDPMKVPPRPLGGQPGAWILVTREIATNLLARPSRNRSNKPIRTSRYSAMLASGRWCRDAPLNLLLDSTGGVLDGGHRLRAIVETGVPMWLCVYVDVPQEVYDFVDSGASRSAADRLLLNKSRAAIVGLLKLFLPPSLDSFDVQVLRDLNFGFSGELDIFQDVIATASRPYKGATLYVGACLAIAAGAGSVEYVTRQVRALASLNYADMSKRVAGFHRRNDKNPGEWSLGGGESRKNNAIRAMLSLEEGKRAVEIVRMQDLRDNAFSLARATIRDRMAEVQQTDRSSRPGLPESGPDAVEDDFGDGS